MSVIDDDLCHPQSSSNVYKSRLYSDGYSVGVARDNQQFVYDNQLNLNANLNARNNNADVKISASVFHDNDFKTVTVENELQQRGRQTTRDAQSNSGTYSSGRRSAIPVPVRSRSQSTGGDLTERTPLKQQHESDLSTKHSADNYSQYIVQQKNAFSPLAYNSQHGTGDLVRGIAGTNHSAMQKRPQSAATGMFSSVSQSRTNHSARMLPQTPAMSQPRTTRVLPTPPAAAPVSQGVAVTPGGRAMGRVLPAVPSASAHNKRRPSSSRTLPTTPASAGTSSRLPTAIGIDRSQLPMPKKSVSQSQPGSRSTSPTSLLGYITYNQLQHLQSTPTQSRPESAQRPASSSVMSIGRPRSCIPRSRGHSRDTSPTQRHTVGTSNGVNMMSLSQLQKGLDMQFAVNKALYQRTAAADDAASETSSVSSDSRIPPHITMDVPEIINHISSGGWSDRRDGLTSLQALLKAEGHLSPLEVKKVTEIFTRMFHDPSAKVFVVFLETLPCFVTAHAADVPSEWVYTCLSRLLERTASDLLKSVSSRLQAALKSVRDIFTVDEQWTALARFVCESTKISDAKVRQSFVEYVHDMVVSMDPSELVNSSDVQQVTLRVIAWMSDRKFPVICRAAQHVIIALFNVNTPEFSVVLASLPRSMQDAAFKLLQNHLSSVSYDVSSAESSSASRRASERSQTNTSATPSEEISSDDFYSSFRKAAEDLQSLSLLE